MVRKKIIIALFITLCFSACKQIQYVPIETERVIHDIKNSVDSVIVNQRDTCWMAGDTVWMQKLSTKYVYRYRADTVYAHDTTAVPYEIKTVEYVTKPLGIIQRALIGIGLLSIIFVVIYAIIKIRF